MIRNPFPQPSIKDGMPARERTYQHLKSNILSGHFNPGERLTEEHLARKLGVSRTPIREALHKLESEGLIQSLVTRGFIVSRDSKDEMEELFDIRAILEGYLMRMICETVSEETLGQLDQIIEKAEEALGQKKIEEVFKWNTQFHDTLHSLVQNKQRFHQMMVNIRKYVLRYRKDTLRYPDGGKRTIEGHRKIMMSLRLRDPDLCERVMREHIHEAKEDALQTTFGKNIENRPPAEEISKRV